MQSLSSKALTTPLVELVRGKSSVVPAGASDIRPPLPAVGSLLAFGLPDDSGANWSIRRKLTVDPGTATVELLRTTAHRIVLSTDTGSLAGTPLAPHLKAVLFAGSSLGPFVELFWRYAEIGAVLATLRDDIRQFDVVDDFLEYADKLDPVPPDQRSLWHTWLT